MSIYSRGELLATGICSHTYTGTCWHTQALVPNL